MNAPMGSLDVDVNRATWQQLRTEHGKRFATYPKLLRRRFAAGSLACIGAVVALTSGQREAFVAQPRLRAAGHHVIADGSRSRSLHQLSARGGGDGSADSAVALVADTWQEEATKSWASDADGTIPGVMPDLTPVGREYDHLARIYFDADSKPLAPSGPKPWKQFAESEAWVPGKEEEDADWNDQDQRNEDFVAMVEFLANDSYSHVTAIDMGCGDGYMARRMLKSEHFSRVVAFDVDWRMLEFARTTAEQRGLGPDQGFFLARGDAQEMPFREGTIDAAWWGMGLHKVQDAGEALRSVASALRPGGRLLATTQSGAFSAEDLEQKAKDAGFSEVQVSKPRVTAFVLKATK